MLSNQEVADQFAFVALLMELHNENAFKIRAIQNASYSIERMTEPVMSLSKEALESADGLGKSLAAKLIDWRETGSFQELETWKSKTPEGVISMIGIKGVGPKRIRTLWMEHGIDSSEKLLEACQNNTIANLKGFGEKSQQNILRALQFKEQHAHEFLYADIEKHIQPLQTKLSELLSDANVSVSGGLARQLEVLDSLEFLVSSAQPMNTMAVLQSSDEWEEKLESSTLFTWIGTYTPESLPVKIHFTSNTRSGSEKILHAAGVDHLRQTNEQGFTYLQLLKQDYATEEAFYESVQKPFVPAYLREGLRETAFFENNTLDQIIQDSDLKGAFHNHSTYSDGQHTLADMANYLQQKGYQYLGISDHSQTASYAGGLRPDRIKQQQEEIKQLNAGYSNFKIFSGIESDILNDGALDYEEDVLKSFDFIVASIHSNLTMNEEKATQRLITAIENPYTTMLGHPTGRLLLKREGYPIDHKKVIDACAANHVIIEINAHPLRLDMDWRHIGYALDKGCIISINPDAHEVKGYHDMHFGVLVAQKAGLTKDRCFNAWPIEEVEAWLGKKKGRTL
ncbi:MAG: helix-hairpin-helix domain-containing protein [Cytophagaceae bacterium]